MLTKEGDKIDDLADLSKADWSNLRDWECASVLSWWAVLTGTPSDVPEQVHSVRVRAALPLFCLR